MVQPAVTTNEKLIQEFDAWVDKLIMDYQSIPFISHSLTLIKSTKIDTLRWAKANLHRIAEEVTDRS